MAVDAKSVLVGAPEQAVTGAVNFAAIGTALPTDATSALTGFTDAGYVSQDGLTLTPDYSTTDINDWSGAVVRTLLESFTGEISWTFIQTSENELKALLGEDNVTVTAANTTHGKQLAIAMGAELAPERSYAFKMKDGDAKVLIVCPNAQIIPDGDITFVANDAISWGCKLSCHPDASGKSIYIYTDDGVKSA